MASISAGVIPSTREARPAAGDHRARDARRGGGPSRGQVLGLRRQQFLREDARERLTGRTISPVVLTSSCSTHPATRVCTCEIRDSSGTTVATARTWPASAIRARPLRAGCRAPAPWPRSRPPERGRAVRRGRASRPMASRGPASGCRAVLPPGSRGANGHASRACCTHSAPVNTRGRRDGGRERARRDVGVGRKAVIGSSPHTTRWRARGAPMRDPVPCPPRSGRPGRARAPAPLR